MTHAATLVQIDPFAPIGMLDVSNVLDNEYWRFCADKVMDENDRFLPDEELTYEEFDLGPDYVLPAGTRVQIEYLWGWLNDNGGVSAPTDYEVTIPGPAKVSHVVHFLLSYYHGSLNREGTEGRFLFIENVTEKDGVVQIHWGT